MVTTGIRRGASVATGLGAGVDAERVSHARKVVTNAIKDPETALRLAYIIESKKLQTTQKPTGDDRPLAPCQNKYELIGKANIVDLLVALEEEDVLDADILHQMTHKGLIELQKYALCLGEKCAVPSKTWGELVRESKRRYEYLGGRRLRLVVFVKCGDEHVNYVVVDYRRGGCFALVAKSRSPKSPIVAIKHASGLEAVIKPPLHGEWIITHNHSDQEATLVQTGSINEIPVVNIFKQAGLLDRLPAPMCDDRVGQVSPWKKQTGPLAILDQGHQASSASAADGNGRSKVRILDKTVPNPIVQADSVKNRGAPKLRAKPPPPKKSRTA